uniref:Uncharacterized protein n=1 Tax=Oryza punctata TaxID=4537 RepID=A0A0E0LEK5_ORYPU
MHSQVKVRVRENHAVAGDDQETAAVAINGGAGKVMDNGADPLSTSTAHSDQRRHFQAIGAIGLSYKI